MKQFVFTKLSGAGNDFIFFDKKISPDLELTPSIIEKLCERHTGIGADGIIVLSDSDGFAFNMSYYNADGSTGSLCANGARCAILFASHSKRITQNSAVFLANNEKYSGEIINEGNIKFNLNSPAKLKLNFKIKAANQLINASYADTGSPHVVVNIRNILRNPSDPRSFFTRISDIPVLELGKEIRFHKDFLPNGVNINFIDLNDNGISIRTYERGVENETLSCGTGSVAAAIIAAINYNLKPPVILHTKSGDDLVVNFNFINNKIEGLSLTGPAKIVFKGEILI